MKIKLGAVLILLALSSVMMLGYQKYNPRPAETDPTVMVPPIRIEPREPLRKPSPDRSIEQPKPETDETDSQVVTLYAMLPTQDDFKLVPIRQTVPQATPLSALKVLAEFQGRGQAEPILPKGTRILDLDVHPTGTATADFSNEIVDNFNGGARVEQILLASIVNTLTQFPEVKRVKITVEGKEIETIGGHVEISEPLVRDVSLLTKSADGEE